MKIINLETIKSVLDRKEFYSEIEKSFLSQSSSDSITPDPLVFDIPSQNGEICIKTAYDKNLSTYCIKQVSYFSDPKFGANLIGTMNIFDVKNGELKLVLDEKGFITSARTACAALVADSYFSKQNGILGIVGAGKQVEFFLQALYNVFPQRHQKIFIRTRNTDKLKKFIKTQSKLYPSLKFISSLNIDDLIQNSDTIFSATPSRQAIFTEKNISNGKTIISIGADSKGKVEISPELLRSSNLFVDSISSNLQLGCIYNGIQKGIITPENIEGEIGEIISGSKKYIKSEKTITIIKLVGLGIQDTYAGNYIFQRL